MHKSNNYLILLFFLILTSISSAQNSDPQNDRFRAMWVYNIANNVDWPNEDTIDVFTIGVYSNSTGVYNQLITLSNSQKIKNKPVKIIHFSRFKKITKTHIIYLGYDKNVDIYRVNTLIEHEPTLLISDRLDDVDNFMVNIRPFDQSSKRIEIDKANIIAHSLGVTDQLLYHGGSEQELKDLYSQQKKELDAQIALMEQKKLEIEELQQEMEEQKELLVEQQALLKTQTQQLQQMTATLEQQKLALQKNENMIQEQEQLISQKQAEVQAQIKEMNEKEVILNEKTAEIETKQAELDDLENQIASSKDALNNANQTIINNEATIKTQKGILMIVAIFLAIIMIFAVFLWKALRKNSKMNKELTIKNSEILNQKNQIEQQATLLETTNKELEKLSIVAENAQNGVVIMNNKGDIEWLNAGFTKMYGYTLQLFINERDKNIIKSSSSNKISELYNKCLKTKTPVTYELASTKRNGEKIYVKTTLTPILNEKDEVEKLVAIDTDISEIKKANDQILQQAEELKKSNLELEKLSIVVRETNNAVLITDGKGNIEWVNPAFTDTFGYTLDEFINNVSKNIIADTTKENVKNSIEKMYKTLSPVSYQLLTHNKEGNEIWIQANLTPIVNNNKIEKIIVVDSDITFIKEAEKEIIEKNNELTTQKEQIEEQNEKIEASIKYAQTIQQSILPIKSKTEEFFNSEIIFNPKDIVSGDFYWFFGNENCGCSYAASVDCTGHGVPGAFMSLIASRVLNEIVITNPTIAPHLILEEADKKIRKALMQEQTNNNDGLDIALVKIFKTNNDKCEINFAGAKRNLFVFENNTENIINIPGTRRSIGGIKKTRKKIDFETQKHIANKNDILYLMTDGFIDQNNVARKRFGSLKTEQIISKIGLLPLSEQKEILSNELHAHMKGTEQRDDITLWIIKI